MKRMEIYWVNLERRGSIQGGLRPCLVVCNNIACKYSPTVIVVPITTKTKKQLPTHMDINLKSPSTALFEQLITVNKEQVGNKITELPEYLFGEAEEKMKISLGLAPAFA
jgi:mRNA interferase MazF